LILNYLTILIKRRRTHFDAALVRAGLGGLDLEYLALAVQFVAPPSRPRPMELVETELHNATCGLQLTVNQQAHCQRGGVPAACSKPAEDRAGCRHFIKMEGLEIEFRSKRRDAILFDPYSSGLQGLADCVASRYRIVRCAGRI
jgi:hypothetical protein